MATNSSPLKATCHCGAVTVQVPSKPTEINECQCTLCRRYASAWAYYNPKDVQISTEDNTPTETYVWGDRTLEFHFCSVCGCVTHWSPIKEGDEMGVNTRLMDPAEVWDVNRKVDFEMLKEPLNVKTEHHAEDKAQY